MILLCLEDNFKLFLIDRCFYSISFGKFDGLKIVVMLCLGVRPASPVGAYQIATVPQTAKNEREFLGLHDLFVAEADAKPVAVGLVDMEGECLFAGFAD